MRSRPASASPVSTGGRVVVGVESWPYRCPPAPFEAAMMMRYLAEQRGVSERTEISVFHTWQKPMETFGPLMVDGFGRFLEQREVDFEGAFQLAGHDASQPRPPRQGRARAAIRPRSGRARPPGAGGDSPTRRWSPTAATWT